MRAGVHSEEGFDNGNNGTFRLRKDHFAAFDGRFLYNQTLAPSTIDGRKCQVPLIEKILLGSLCTTVFYFGGNFAGTILFHNTDAGLYIRTLSFICPFLYTNIALTSILNGLGKTGTTLVHSVLGILLRISFVIFAIPVLGIRGYLYGLLLSEILLSLLHIYALYHMEF
mgnify:CR=1 FL=1